MKKLNELRQELIDLKEMNLSIAKEYGSELSAGDMFRREDELEEKIKKLEEKDTTMYLVLGYGQSYKKADSVGVYSSHVGEAIHFNKKPDVFDGELISSDDKRFWEIINESASDLNSNINNLEYSLRIANKNKEFINKAYERRED